MILVEHVIKGTTTPVTITPIGDLQWNGDESQIASTHFHEHVQKVLSLPHPLFLGTGDYVDFASPSNREALASVRLYDNARKAVGDTALSLADECYTKLLEPTRGKWLGMLSGHHYYPLITGGTTDTYLAGKLGAPFLGVDAVVRVSFQDKERNHHSQFLDIWCHHGTGSSKKPWGPLLKRTDLATNWDCDVFVMGHMTKKAKADVNRVYPVFSPKGAWLNHKSIHLVGAGGWSKAFAVGSAEGTYVERGMLLPVVLGAPIIHVRPKWRMVGEGGLHKNHQRWDPGITVEV